MLQLGGPFGRLLRTNLTPKRSKPSKILRRNRRIVLSNTLGQINRLWHISILGERINEIWNHVVPKHVTDLAFIELQGRLDAIEGQVEIGIVSRTQEPHVSTSDLSVPAGAENDAIDRILLECVVQCNSLQKMPYA